MVDILLARNLSQQLEASDTEKSEMRPTCAAIFEGHEPGREGGSKCGMGGPQWSDQNGSISCSDSLGIGGTL